MPDADTTMPSIYTAHQQYYPYKGIPRRSFDPAKTRRYGRPTFQPQTLVKFSPKWNYSRIFNFPYPGAGFVPRMNTVVVQVHGIAAPNSSTDPDSRAAAGAYFGPNCSHNLSFLLSNHVDQTNNRAVLEATRAVLSHIIQLRHTVLDPRWKEIIIMTNSEYMKMSLAHWVRTWELNGWVRTKQQEPIKHVDLMKEVHKLLTHIEITLNMSVRFWKVDREDVAGADTLAKQTLKLAM